MINLKFHLDLRSLFVQVQRAGTIAVYMTWLRLLFRLKLRSCANAKISLGVQPYSIRTNENNVGNCRYVWFGKYEDFDVLDFARFCMFGIFI